MKLVYIDESGDTIMMSQGGSKWFTLTAYIVDESDRIKIEKDLRDIKKEFYKNPDVEFKSNFIRYANPDINSNSPLKLHSRDRYNDLEDAMTKYLSEIPGVVVSVAIDKEYFWQKNPAQSPYEMAYKLLLENVQLYLDESDSFGIVIIDPREGRVEKSFIGDHLEQVHHKMRFQPGEVQDVDTPSIVERLLYSDSASTIGIQIADMFCYPVFHIFEYSKKIGEYWRYDKTTAKKLFKGEGKESCVIVFSKDTKNDLE